MGVEGDSNMLTRNIIVQDCSDQIKPANPATAAPAVINTVVTPIDESLFTKLKERPLLILILVIAIALGYYAFFYEDEVPYNPYSANPYPPPVWQTAPTGAMA